MRKNPITPGYWKWKQVAHPILADHVGFVVKTGTGSRAVTICEIHVRPYCSVAVNRSNAELIAAAPELYNALKGLLKLVEDSGVVPPLPELIASREALAKADGGNQ